MTRTLIETQELTKVYGAGEIAVSDPIKESTLEAVETLHDLGLRIIMLTGDNEKTAKTVAEKLGIDEFEAGVRPEDKHDRIKSLKADGRKVAMAGDGINDAPALAQADLSITVAGGTDIAGETSDLVLMRPDLTLIPWFIALSRRTRRIIRENLGWAFAYNLVAVPLAAFGLISPVIAAAAMATSSLLVVGNSLRLRR